MAKDIVGLNLDEVTRSREKHGDNALPMEKTKSFMRKFFENLNDPIIKVLIFALIIHRYNPVYYFDKKYCQKFNRQTKFRRFFIAISHKINFQGS